MCNALGNVDDGIDEGEYDDQRQKVLQCYEEHVVDELFGRTRRQLEDHWFR